MAQRKQTIRRKADPKRNALLISLHPSQAVILLLAFSVIGAVLGVFAWKGFNKAREIKDRPFLYDELIVKYGLQNGVDPPLLKAVIWKESRFNAQARGDKGEIGLMQLLPGGAVKDWEDRFHQKVKSKGLLTNPELNIQIGSWYLGRALERWKDYTEREALALCEYNAGLKRADSWKPLLHDGEVIPNIDIESTRKYVKDILERRDKYKREWNWEKHL